MAVSATNNAGGTTNLTVAITLDNTLPTDSISLSSASGAFLSGSTVFFNKNTGGSFKLVDAVTDNGSGPASATFPGLSTTGWTGHTTGETVSSGSGSAPTVTYTSGTYAFSTSGAGTSGTVTSKDVLGNTSSPGAALTFTPDVTATAPTLSFPANTASYTNAVWDAAGAVCATSTICGTATDAGSGIQKVEISVQQGTGNYWNGSSFSSGSQVWNLGTGTTSWSLPFASSNFPAGGAYTVSVRTTDNVGNLSTSTTATFTIDNIAPTVTLTKVNGSTVAFPLTISSTVITIGGGCGTATGDTATVSWSVTGSATESGSTPCSSGTWAATLTTPLTAGSYTLSATQSDAAGNTGSSGNQSLTDNQPPQLLVTGITSANGGATAGQLQTGDTFAVTFNHALNPGTINTTAGATTITLAGGGSNTTITINTLTAASGFVVGSNYEKSGKTSTASGTLSLSNGNKTVTFTVTGAPTNSGNIKAGGADYLHLHGAWHDRGHERQRRGPGLQPGHGDSALLIGR